MEYELARRLLQRRARLVVDGDAVRILHPRWPQPWAFEAGTVVFVLLDAVRGPAPEVDTGQPAVFPRIELVRKQAEKAPELYLVPHAPVRVPATDPPRWCDVIGLTLARGAIVDVWDSPMVRPGSLGSVLVDLYGTTAAPRLRPDQMQTGWHVEGLGLTRSGAWSLDPRPIARSTGSAPESVQRKEGRRRWAAALLGSATALAGAVAWASVMHSWPDVGGKSALALGAVIGLAVRAPRWHAVRADPRLGLLAVVLTAVSLVLGIAAFNVADNADYYGMSLMVTARSMIDSQGWVGLFGGWLDDWLGYAVLALSGMVAYAMSLGGSTGSATRVT